jgi:hypothetical protein
MQKSTNGLTVRGQTINVLEENTTFVSFVNHCNLRFGNGFLAITPKSQTTKHKLDILNFKTANFCPSKDTIENREGWG